MEHKTAKNHFSTSSSYKKPPSLKEIHMNNSSDTGGFTSISEELLTYQRAIENLLMMPTESLEIMKRQGSKNAYNQVIRTAKQNVNERKMWTLENDKAKSFRHQILDISDSIIKKHISESNNWSYKVGFSCHNCDFSWEVEHVVNDLAKSLSDPYRFVDSCETKSPPSCLCPSIELLDNEELKKRVEVAVTGCFNIQKAIEWKA